MPQIQKKKGESAKNMKNIIQMSVFLQNRKNPETEIFVFCVITFDTQAKTEIMYPKNEGAQTATVFT